MSKAGATSEKQDLAHTVSYQVSGSQPLQGDMSVPGDKSISHRALMLGAIASGTTRVTGLLEGEDCLNTARALRQMGVEITVEENSGTRTWIINGAGKTRLQESQTLLDMGNSGTGLRLMTGLLVGQNVTATLSGDHSLLKRPMERIAKPLRQMGAQINTIDGCPPVTIEKAGSLDAIDYQTPVASAQIKSAILLAALGAEGQTRVTEPAQSRDHTERLLPAFGCAVETDENTVILNGPAKLSGIDIDVPGDISSAAFFMVAATVIPDSDITITNVGINPTRVGVINILQAMGASIDILNQHDSHGEPVADIRIQHANLTGIDVPPKWVPSAIDEFPVIFIAAACAEGITRVSGAAELKVKESNRITAMATGLSVLGVNVNETDDGLEVTGGTIGGGIIDSCDDHRIAMAFAIAGAVASEPVTINDCENVTTSFPGFAELATRMGLELQLLKWPGR